MSSTATAVQKEAFPLAGLLTKVNVQTLAQLSMLNLTKPDIGVRKPASYMRECSVCKSVESHRSPEFIGDYHSAKVSAQNLSKPDIGKGAGGAAEGFSVVTTREELSFVTITCEGFSDSIKKGCTVNAALWFCASVNQSSGFLQPCRCSISRFKAAVTNCPVLSPGALTFSTAFITSCGTRAATVWDLAFIALVAIPIHSSTSVRQYARETQSVQHLTAFAASLILVFNTLSAGKTQEPQITTPRAVEAAPRRLTKPLIGVTIMAGSQHTQTHPKFTWRFLALSADTRNVISITAATEREARDQSPAGCVMVFAGRLPAQEVSYVA